LPNPKEYTGHSFRRTSATLLADAGADLLTLKRHGGWRSSTAAEGYVQDSITSKRKIGELIAGQVELSKRTSTVTSSSNSSVQSIAVPAASDTTLTTTTVACSQSVIISEVKNVASESPIPHMQFSNCTVNINFNK
jgi:hypothetical protein